MFPHDHIKYNAEYSYAYQTDHEIAKGTWMTPEIGQYLFTAISFLVQK